MLDFTEVDMPGLVLHHKSAPISGPNEVLELRLGRDVVGQGRDQPVLFSGKVDLRFHRHVLLNAARPGDPALLNDRAATSGHGTDVHLNAGPVGEAQRVRPGLTAELLGKIEIPLGVLPGVRRGRVDDQLRIVRQTRRLRVASISSLWVLLEIVLIFI